MKYWITSDTHFGHKNIIKYTGRPFKTLSEMNETLIKNWNNRVAHDDTVLFLGDFCFKNSSGGKAGEGIQKTAQHWLKQLNGNKVFIRGNHDTNNSLNAVIENMVIHHGGQYMWLTHRPQDFNPVYKVNLVGHVHEKWKIIQDKKHQTILVNVGVDKWNFMPIDINEIMAEISKAKKEGFIKMDVYKQ